MERTECTDLEMDCLKTRDTANTDMNQLLGSIQNEIVALDKLLSDDP